MPEADNVRNAILSTTVGIEMARELIEQLASKASAAAMFRCIFERVLPEEALNRIFKGHAKTQVECEILNKRQKGSGLFDDGFWIGES